MQGEAKFMIYSIKEMSHLSNTGEFESKIISFMSEFNKTKIINKMRMEGLV